MRQLLTTLFMLSFAGLSHAGDYAAGQLWSYKARPGEEASTLLINKVETDPKFGQIFHISVSGVTIRDPKAPTGATSELPHLPVSKATLDASVTKLLSTAHANTAYLDGYNIWRPAFDQGQAGVFTIPVREVVNVVEQTISVGKETRRP